MPRRSLKTSTDLLPNGRNKDLFHRECFDFMETFHDRLMGYAMYIMRGDQEEAHDLLHSTFLVLLQGGDKIDFTHSPCAYFNLMMKRERERNGRVKQRGFEGSHLRDEWTIHSDTHDEEPHEIGNAYDEWVIKEREDTSFRDLAMRFPELMTCLTHTERTHMEWYLDGLSYADIQKKHKVTVTRIGQILTKARKKLKVKAEALLRDGSSGGLGR